MSDLRLHHQRPSFLAALAVDSFLWFLRCLSVKARERLAWFVGSGVFALGIRRKVTLDNLALAMGELPLAERRRIARGAYINMTLMFLDALASKGQRQGGLVGRYTLGNSAAFEEAVKAGKGVILVSGHYGSWEMLGEILAPIGVRLSVVAKPLKGALNARLIEHRLAQGARMIFPRGAISESLQALQEGRVVLLLIDQAMPAEKGVFVPFFGQPASTTPIASLLAKRSAAPVFLGMTQREAEGIRIDFEGPFPLGQSGDPAADAQAHTAALTAGIERFIRKKPDQWLWLHRRWKVKPPPA